MLKLLSKSHLHKIKETFTHLEESDAGDLILHQFVQICLGGESDGWWTSLLVQPGDNLICGSSTCNQNKAKPSDISICH